MKRSYYKGMKTSLSVGISLTTKESRRQTSSKCWKKITNLKFYLQWNYQQGWNKSQVEGDDSKMVEEEAIGPPAFPLQTHQFRRNSQTNSLLQNLVTIRKSPVPQVNTKPESLKLVRRFGTSCWSPWPQHSTIQLGRDLLALSFSQRREGGWFTCPAPQVFLGSPQRSSFSLASLGALASSRIV